MRSRTWLVAALLFGSGFCALVYQIAWLRDFRLIFGASTAASAAVLAIFIGGLGVGGMLLGPRADRHPRPLLFYAQLEAIVALSAAATPELLALIRSVYLATGGSARLGTVAAAMVRIGLSAVVLAVPTVAMGGTLPAAARGVTRILDARRQDVAALYALNTLGAVTGCAAATFWLLEVFGTHKTLWLAALANLLVALLARQVERASPTLAESRDGSLSVAEPQRAIEPQAADAGSPAPAWFVLTAAAVVGFAFFLMELIWYRMLGPLLGGSVFTFGLVLAVALAGVGVGGLVYALVAGDKPATLSGFGSCCLFEALAVAATYALGDRLAVLTLALGPLGAVGFGARVAAWTLVTALTVLPAALVAGYQFPLLIALFGRGREHVGRQIGQIYAANTLGAIVGSLAGGFGLLPWLSATGAWQAAAVVLLALGMAAVALAPVEGTTAGRFARIRVVLTQAGIAAAVALCLVAAGPSAVWRHSGIGVRRAGDVFASPNLYHAWTSLARRSIVWQADGVESSVALSVDPTGYAFIVNGKSDGAARGDAGTQVMLGLLGALSTPQPRRALVIGLGTGSSAGWLGAIPAMERVDVVELEPLVLDVARASAPVNHEVLGNPKVHVAIGDARETLLTTRDRYDIIASEPSNPYRAGVASLFTEEYYRAAAGRLTDDGVFAQWVQGYEIDTRTLRTIYATLAAVFPQIDTWQTQGGDLVLVASRRHHTFGVGTLLARIAEEPFKSALGDAWRAIDIHGVLAHYVANDSLARAAAGTAGVDVNTDDRNVVEFGLARSVGQGGSVAADVRTQARAAGMSRPPLDDDRAIQWPRVATALVSYQASEGMFQEARYDGPPGEQARQAALMRYYQNGDLSGARGLWAQQTDAPRDPGEMMMLADIAASAGEEAALPLIEEVRAYQPAVADLLLSTLRLRQSRLDDAAGALEASLQRLRTDPWPLSPYKDRAVQLAPVLAARNPVAARRMFDLIAQPFAVRAVEDSRAITKAEMTRQVDFPMLCGGAVHALEPHVPWTESFLRLRYDCYRTTGDPLLAAAARDLAQFLGNLPQPLIRTPSRAPGS